MNSNKANPVIPANAAIGHIAAEADDEFLFNCFVDHPALQEIKNRHSPKMIILGSTGIGKTAILRALEKDEERCQNIRLDEMSLSYISNSDVINFILALDVSLDRFFQALWKHVICIEYIKLRFSVDSQMKSQNWWRRVSERFRDNEPKKKALKYLERWENRFWVSFDENVREITESLESDINANFAAELEKFKSDAGYRKKISIEKKKYLQQRLRKFVDADLLTELAQVINLLSEYDVDAQATNFVLIDRLDDDWVSGNVRYHLIRSLVEALKNLRRIEDLKVVVALRSDIMERVILETKELGFQSEKYEDYILRLMWNQDQLKDIINKRINFLYRRKYSSDNIFFEDIFINDVGKENSFRYISERTLLRPRDVITFVNQCLGQAAGKPQVRRGDVYAAETVYSENRLEALADEWRPIFAGIEPCIRILRGKRQSFLISELNTTKTIDDLVSSFYSKESYQNDKMMQMLDSATREHGDEYLWEILVELIDRLHLVGVIGVSLEAEKPVQWFFRNQRRLSRSSIDPSKKIRIHPMLYLSLGIIR